MDSVNKKKLLKFVGILAILLGTLGSIFPIINNIKYNNMIDNDQAVEVEATLLSFDEKRTSRRSIFKEICNIDFSYEVEGVLYNESDFYCPDSHTVNTTFTVYYEVDNPENFFNPDEVNFKVYWKLLVPLLGLGLLVISIKMDDF